MMLKTALKCWCMHGAVGGGSSQVIKTIRSDGWFGDWEGYEDLRFSRIPMHLSGVSDGEAVAVPAGDLLDLDPLQRLDGLRVEHVAGVAVPQPPEVSPAN